MSWVGNVDIININLLERAVLGLLVIVGMVVILFYDIRSIGKILEGVF
jgi:hypothetical protein